MSWKKHFQIVPTKKLNAPQAVAPGSNEAGAMAGKFGSWLPEVYSGQPNRIERYAQYDQMDNDSEINQALDTIADFGTQQDDKDDLPFEIHYHDDMTESEVTLLETALRQWSRLNDVRQRLWRIFRNTIKYGDQFFIRDPETYVWLWVDHTKVSTVVVNESMGKRPEQYVISDLELNLQAKVASNEQETQSYTSTPSSFPSPHTPRNLGTGHHPGRLSPLSQRPVGGLERSMNTTAVDAEHVIHLSLSEGMDANWPFGNSILEPIFKTYKQKELLEDAIIIYRVQRAPERRVFYIDVGNMPTHKAMAFVERIKNEIHQRRIPNRTGGGTSILDAAYNPLCLALDTTIRLSDGSDPTLQEIIDRFNVGESMWCCACSPNDGQMLHAPISWAGVTRKDTKTIQVLFEDGSSVICTPDHKFPTPEGFVEAQKLHGKEVFHYSNKKLITCIGWESAGTRDTGTITVDAPHAVCDWHTFYLGNNIACKNSIVEDYFFAQSAEGRGSKVETLPGGENLGDIDDLRFFNSKLVRGLRVPSSYLPSGPEDGTQPFTDGRVGTAYIQEFRFAKYVARLQSIMDPVFDKEFKLYLKKKGVMIAPNVFNVQFSAPQNFSKFRQIEIDSAYINVFGQLQAVPWIARRTLALRYLGWSEDEVLENERVWKEENPSRIKNKVGQTAADSASAPVPTGFGGGEPLGGGEPAPDLGDIAAGGDAGDAGLGGEETGGADAGGGIPGMAGPGGLPAPAPAGAGAAPAAPPA